MPLSHSYRVIYFHIPKTAGASFNKLLKISNKPMNICRTLW